MAAALGRRSGGAHSLQHRALLAVLILPAEPNDVGEPIHPKAMPVILKTEEERDTRLRADWSEAMDLQRPLQAGALMIVARGMKSDGANS